MRDVCRHQPAGQLAHDGAEHDSGAGACGGKDTGFLERAEKLLKDKATG